MFEKVHLRGENGGLWMFPPGGDGGRPGWSTENVSSGIAGTRAAASKPNAILLKATLFYVIFSPYTGSFNLSGIFNLLI